MYRLTPCLIALVALPVGAQLLAKGGNMRSEDRYDPQHIENLPLEIRKQVLKLCPAPKALHEFASYSDHLRKVVLHFEHLYCGAKPFCGPSGCLHQTYALSGGHYRLLESYSVPEGSHFKIDGPKPE
jgi:hypothetical protein